MIKHISRVVIGSLGLSVVFVQGLQTQPVYNEQSGLASAFELVAIDSKARAIVSRDHYGSLGIAGVSIFLFDISPGRSESSYFGRQVMLQVQAGAGTWHQKGSLANDITVEFFEIGMKIPVSPLFQVSGFSDNVGISVFPTLGFPSMRNYNTGNFSGVLTRGIGVGLDVKLFEFMTASLEYQWTTVNRKPFLWSDVYETLNLGLSFGLGRELSNTRESHEYNDALRQRVRVTEDSLVAMHEKLRDAQKKETKDSPTLVSVVQNLVSEIQSLRNELSASQHPSGGDSFAGSNGQNATFKPACRPCRSCDLKKRSLKEGTLSRKII
ncbi:MAG: hypothetical protein HYY49_00295 [Ignavibacteriales bacterium]|nr:hypothetical protein [Ignavibacteriales bacterium]